MIMQLISLSPNSKSFEIKYEKVDGGADEENPKICRKTPWTLKLLHLLGAPVKNRRNNYTPVCV